MFSAEARVFHHPQDDSDDAHGLEDLHLQKSDFRTAHLEVEASNCAITTVTAATFGSNLHILLAHNYL